MFHVYFFDEIPVSKHYSPRLDAAFAFSGVLSGSILFVYRCPIKRTPGLCGFSPTYTSCETPHVGFLAENCKSFSRLNVIRNIACILKLDVR